MPRELADAKQAYCCRGGLLKPKELAVGEQTC